MGLYIVFLLSMFLLHHVWCWHDSDAFVDIIYVSKDYYW